jgi:hypothetical protein
MVLDVVATPVYLAYYWSVRGGPGTNTEEAGAHAPSVEQVEDLWSNYWVWSVIERQCYLPAPNCWRRQPYDVASQQSATWQ